MNHYKIKVQSDNNRGYYNILVQTKTNYSFEELKEKLCTCKDLSLDEQEDMEFSFDYERLSADVFEFFKSHNARIIELEEMM